MNWEKIFTPQIIGILKTSQSTALSMNRHCVDIDIFFDCFLDDLSLSCDQILEKYNIKQSLYDSSDAVIKNKKENKNVSDKIDKKLLRFFENCYESATSMYHMDYIPPEVIFLNFLDSDLGPKAMKPIIENELLVDEIITEITFSLNDVDLSLINGPLKLEKTQDGLRSLDMFKDNAILSQFAENLNIKALKGGFDKIVDFDNKISEIATILCRKKKPNVILVGTAGTGKTSLVEGLVNKIVNGEAPELLSNKVIYSVSLSSMVAGTSYRGQFEQRLESFVNEAKKYENVILFIDEVHTLVGAGGSGGSNESLEASNILKPELARGTISCIGATTINEYKATIKKDSALDRRFEMVTVREPSKFQMKKILPTIMSYYEDFHNVSYSDEFINNIIEYCERFSPNKHYPDKAVDVVDHCGAQAKVKHFELHPEIRDMQKEIIKLARVDADDQSLIKEFEEKAKTWSQEAGEKKAGVDLTHLESFFSRKANPMCDIKVLDEVFFDFDKRFAGHQTLIKKLKEQIIISNYNLDCKKSSPSIFCINGKERTGKSYFTSILKENFERSGINTISYSGVHFSDYYAPHKIASSSSNGSSLCEKILIYPNSAIIIDGFDAIHDSALALFSQIFKDGRLELSNGECADFSHCKFFLTSGAKTTSELGFSSYNQEQESMIIKDLSSSFDSNLFLHRLGEKDLRRALWNKMTNVKKSLSIKGVELSFGFNFLSNFVKENSGDNFEIEVLNKSFDSKINKYVQKKIIEGKKFIKMPKKVIK
jgi:ATP-dependent Clp protease ATP-binding subunit ClpC